MTKITVASLAAHQRQHLVLQPLPRHRVERAERLVHQQRLRLLREAARDLQALLHAAGHLRRIFLGVAGQADLAQQLVDAAGALGARHAARLQRQRDVAGGGAPRQQRLAVILEHDRDLAARLEHRLAVEGDLAAGRLIEAGREPQRGGLAAARGADDAEEFAGPHVKAEILDNGLAAKPKRRAVKGDQWLLLPRRLCLIKSCKDSHRSLSLAGGIDEIDGRVQVSLQHFLSAGDVARSTRSASI